MKERNTAVPASYLILKKNDEILLSRRFNTGYEDGNWSLPSGHVEADEVPITTLIREAQEEVGIVIKPGDGRLVHIMYRAKRDKTGQRIDLFFVVEKWSGGVINKEPEKCDSLTWFPVNQLPEHLIEYVCLALTYYQKGILYSEYI